MLADAFDAMDENPKVSGREALKVLRLADALLRSAETARREAVARY